jgi:probable pyridine nucleotide-disulfide oxidoreductase
MNDPETYDAVVLGGGKGGKTLAMYLARQNYKVAMIERDPMMVGGGCINLACIPTKTFIASARVVHSIRRAAEFGIKVEGVSIDWPGVRKRVEEVVSEMRALNLKNFTSFPRLDFILGTGRFLGPTRRRSSAKRWFGPSSDLQALGMVLDPGMIGTCLPFFLQILHWRMPA